MTINVQQGWNLTHTPHVAALYEEAFGSKFCRAIPDKHARIRLLASSFMPEYSFAALYNNQVVGIAGFKVASGALTGKIGMQGLIEQLGWLRGLRAGLVFSLFEREPKACELVMDGIAVDRHFRGKGVGSLLLDHMVAYAKDNGFDSVRLDVIDGNPRAKKLYEAKGFVAQKHEQFHFLKDIVGFSGATTMIFEVNASG